MRLPFVYKEGKPTKYVKHDEIRVLFRTRINLYNDRLHGSIFSVYPNVTTFLLGH